MFSMARRRMSVTPGTARGKMLAGMAVELDSRLTNVADPLARTPPPVGDGEVGQVGPVALAGNR